MIDSPSYTVNGDGTVTDNGTGLVWQQAAQTTGYTQTAALTYCSTLSLGGYTDWRLPSAIELVSIVDPGASRPSINTTVFLSTPALPFWSSTTYDAPNDAYFVSFLDGSVQFTATFYTDNVRCVR